MFNQHRTYHSHSKKQKLSDKNNYLSLSNINSLKNDFLLEINGDKESNLHRNSSIVSWIKYDLTKCNKQLDLSGGDWSVGIEGLIIRNSLNSWKNVIESKTNLPSLAFIKIGIKYKGKATEIMGVKFFENRLYSKFKIISQLNTFLSGIWTKSCHTNSDGINIVGEMFSLMIFAFYMNRIDDSIHITSIANISSPIGKKIWTLFAKIFDNFKKEAKNEIERVEVFISNELNSYLGDFKIPREISNSKSDKDLTDYDQDSIALDVRCGFIPNSTSDPAKESHIHITPKNKIPDFRPSIISIYTNIPITERANETLINGGIYQLLAQIPIKSLTKNSPSFIHYFPEKISYKTISQNYNLDTIEILLVDPETNELISLNNTFMVNLDFKRMS